MRIDQASPSRSGKAKSGSRSDTSDRSTGATNGAEFLSRALVARAIRRSDARQILLGGAGALGIVVDEVEDATIVTKGAGFVLRSTARAARFDWRIEDRISRPQDTSRRAGSDLRSEELDEAARTIVVMDAATVPSLWLEAMSDGIVRLGRPDWPLVEAAFKTLMGQSPASALPPEFLAVIPFRAYGSAIRPGAGCGRALARLRRLAERRLAGRTTAATGTGNSAREPSVEDLHGYGAAGEWAKTLAQDLDDYRAGRIRWQDVDRGILLSGPPGTGKTTFAKALGRTCNVPVHIHSLAAWQARGYLNDLLKAMREAFDKAKAAAPCVLFIDEIDSFGDRETLRGDNERYGREVINGFLECLDGANGRDGVVVVGATNHPSAIDAGIKRPGRLDRHIVIPLPDAGARVGILRHHLGGDLAATDLTPIAERLDGASGAALEQIVREGRRRARTSRRPLELADLEACLPPMVRLSPAALRRACVHEAGHLLAGLLLASETGSMPLDACVRTEVLGSDAGFTRFRSEKGFDQTRSSWLAEATVLLSGLGCERVLLGDVGPGGGGVPDSDLARATLLLAEIELSHGLGDSLFFLAPRGSSDLSACLRREPELRQRIEVQLQSCMDRSVSLLTSNRSTASAIADVLGQAGRITEDEARVVLASHASGTKAERRSGR